MRAAITFLRSGGQAALRAHTLLIDTRPTPSAAKFPRVLGDSDADGIVRVVFSSRLTTAQQEAARRTFTVRRRRVSDLLAWLLDNNHLYAGVVVEPAAVDLLPDVAGGGVPEGLFLDADEEDEGAPHPPTDGGGATAEAAAAAAGGAPAAATSGADCEVEVVRDASVVVQVDYRTEEERVRTAFEETVRVRRSGPVMRDGEFGDIEAAFVTVFPFGRGNPSEKRPVYLSETEVIRRVMLDGYREFGRNQLLLVHAFDRAARIKMLRKGCLRLQRSPDDVGRVCHVTLEELRAELRRDERRKRRRVAGVADDGGDGSADGGADGGDRCGPWGSKRPRKAPGVGASAVGAAATAPLVANDGTPERACGGADGGGATSGGVTLGGPAVEAPGGTRGGLPLGGDHGPRLGRRHAKRLLRLVWAAASAYDGSNEQRAAYRQETYAMCNHFGLPQVFFTFSPNDIGSATLWYYAGVIGGDIFTSFNVGHLLSKSERFRTLARDPVAGARFFRRLTDIVVDTLIGWCSARGRPLARGGAFGRCKGFYGAIEAQARGSPHIHMLIWLIGHAPSAKEFTKLLRNEDRFRRNWWAWAEDLVHANLPTSTETVTCPECSSPVAAVPVTAAFRGLQPRAAMPPVVAACVRASCDGTLTSMAALHQQQHKAVGLPIGGSNASAMSRCGGAVTSRGIHSDEEAPDGGDGASKALFDGDAVDEMMATPNLPNWDGVSGHAHHGEVYESALAMATQMHSHRHSVSCFKRTRSGKPRECRYGFPREPREEAEIDGEGGFLVRRPVGCEYINPHNRLVLVTLRCNTDLRILQANDVVLYTVKYVLKPMADDERDAILMLNRFQRVVNAEQTDPPRTVLRTATRRVCALAYAATERQEMPATLAAIYLLYKEGRITSHTFVPLLMPQLLAFH